MCLSAADIMCVQVASGCDLTESFSVGMIQQAIYKRKPGEKSEELSRHQAVNICLQYVLRSLDWQNLTQQTFKAKAGLSEDL